MDSSYWKRYHDIRYSRSLQESARYLRAPKRCRWAA